MSLCRVIIRLEIEDSAGTFIDIQYNADVSLSPVSELQQPVYRSVCLDVNSLAACRGKRQSRPITVELYSVYSLESEKQSMSAASTSPTAGPAAAAAGIGSGGGIGSVASTGGAVEDGDVQGNWASWSESESAESNQKGSTVFADSEVVTSDLARPGSGKVWSKTGLPSHCLKFFSGNPSVETTEGIIHLYKENNMMPSKGDAMRSSMICMLKVPATFSSQDLLQFIAPIEPGLEHIRIIRDGTPNQYMVLLTFRDQVRTDEFYQTYNERPFNSIEPEICHLAYVAQVESVLTSEGAGLPPSGCTELPNCTVCLERMDESVKGILTILCNHSFHVACLAEWKDTSCPVCRYVQTPVPTADNKCFECSAQVNLWICLICGFVGCGRYVEGHAYGHFKDTSHTYSMELGSNRVWDYTGDNYVHRLVQNKTDGKLVEVDEHNNIVHEEKIDALNLEYTYLLTTQLESQRLYFEERMQSVERQSQRQVEELETKVKKAIEEMTKLEQQLVCASKDRKLMAEELAKLEQHMTAVNKEKQKMSVRLTKVTSELEEERQLNSCLRDNQATWQLRVNELEDKLAKKDIEMTELRDQLRDVMFFLEAKDTLASTSGATQEEIEQGQIIVQSSPSEATASASAAARKSRCKKR